MAFGSRLYTWHRRKTRSNFLSENKFAKKKCLKLNLKRMKDESEF